MSLLPYAMVDTALIPKYAGIMGERRDFATVSMVNLPTCGNVDSALEDRTQPYTSSKCKYLQKQLFDPGKIVNPSKPSLFPLAMPPSAVKGLRACCVLFYYPSHVQQELEPDNGHVLKTTNTVKKGSANPIVGLTILPETCNQDDRQYRGNHG
ncbi:hypothetical protein ARMSODRAFT_980994 [Armillaria solidipes]|uniref:Uncharacterized protein n=1 Tax=Armillaria solidipes TaxID=1076256 RepID=A0A2H3AWV1_9AGAR|nr:hypothetical protein ARMSODRAFT_980994 [Armillaria solidipes]